MDREPPDLIGRRSIRTKAMSIEKEVAYRYASTVSLEGVGAFRMRDAATRICHRKALKRGPSKTVGHGRAPIVFWDSIIESGAGTVAREGHRPKRLEPDG